jgi:integrase
MVINALKEWKLSCPKRTTVKQDAVGDLIKVLDLVFPNGHGKVEQVNNIVRRGLQPIQLAAGFSVDIGEVDEQGNAIMAAKYTGLHALRHFYASWCINRLQDGGLGLPAKVVQERLGHSSIVMTMDVWPLVPAGRRRRGNGRGRARSSRLNATRARQAPVLTNDFNDRRRIVDPEVAGSIPANRTTFIIPQMSSPATPSAARVRNCRRGRSCPRRPSAR